MTATKPPSLNFNALKEALSGIEVIADPLQVAKLSQDYHNFSPILQAKLSGKSGDLVARVKNEKEVLQVASACVKYKVPLTVRGAGTGNYGQCVPLYGGVILDVSPMQEIRWIKPGSARVEAGAKLGAIDKKAREIGWEMRMVPSTFRTATIGGYIAGGSAGSGSVTYGQLRDRGNITALRVVTMEDEPRALELRGDDIYKVNHAWGLTGIITEIEIPLAPAYPWAELIVAFDDFMAAARFGQALSDADGLAKKLVSIHAAPIPSYFTAVKNFIPEGAHCALLAIAEFNLESLQGLIDEYGGKICYQKPASEATKGITLTEFGWNHTTLHARNADPSLTYLQTLFPSDKYLKLVEHLYNYFGDEVMMHLEFIRVNGEAVPAALQVVRYTSEERLNEIIRYHEEHGAFIANPHTYIIEDGGRKIMDPQQVEFKELVDPYGLLNPGKMRTWTERG